MLKSVRFLLILLTLLFVTATIPTKAQSAPAWQPNTAYTVNTLVTYNGATYKCIQAHTSLVGWEPPNVPALWQLQTGSPATATRTPTRTNTPNGPTNTPITPTKTPTNNHRSTYSDYRRDSRLER